MKDISEVIQKAQNDDVNALGEVLKETEKEAYAFLYYLSKSEIEISDIVQETLLKVAKNIKNLKEVKVFKSWVNKIIIREYYNALRKNKRKKEYTDLNEIDEKTETEKFKDNHEPMEDCIECELIGVIKSSVCKLKEPYRLALIMREFEGLTYEEIAKLTKTSVGTVKSRIARARGRMKEWIKPYMEQI